MAYASDADAREVYAGASASEARLRAVMASAAGMVQRIAPAPDPVPTDYPGLASSAELMAGQYFWLTGGFVKRDTDLDTTTEYQTFEGVEAAIRNVMGAYVKEDVRQAGASYTLDVASTFPAADLNELPTA